MNIITNKAIVQAATAEALSFYAMDDGQAFIRALDARLLTAKVRFPLLETAARQLSAAIPEEEKDAVLEQLIALNRIGSYVVAGMMLQLRLEHAFRDSLDKAAMYMIRGDEWYVCDIIGERVMGYALLTKPEQMLPVLREMAGHENKWIVRSIGVAVHYAVKKGLKKTYVVQAFELLLSLGTTTDHHTKKGIGWAVKTVAKFHPDIITQSERTIAGNPAIRTWFKTKIRIGLSRTDKYAQRYTG